MTLLDYLVLIGYFAVMIGIGVYTSRKIKAQEDFFMGGRSFGKLLQTFAAFGAGTGSSDPVNAGRTTFTSGMSGMWSVMYWLFVTPFYWITGVWYRRMRHLTLGDWFVERYESKRMGAAYCVFGLLFFMVYGSMLFSAIGKAAAPLMTIDSISYRGHELGIEYILVPTIGVVVLAYGILGGLRAAYLTDLIQGICIIVLSIVLIPYGLQALVDRFGDPNQDSMLAGFRILHEQLPREHFHVVGATSASEFPLHRILAIVVINLVGVVVQPHFIATGGGSAKTEMNARVGLVVGNFLKRFCTIGWVLTALIALALFADRPDLVEDPDKTWGVASRELLGPGLTGLMLACLLAALMSSIDAYMIVGSGLVVRNFYAPYINPNASEKEYIFVGRLTGAIVIVGAVIISLFMMDVFAQLQLTWIVPMLFAVPFWVGMYWRRATTAAAWWTIAYCATVFLIAPLLVPLLPGMTSNPRFTLTNDIVVTTTTRAAAPSDVARRDAEIILWERQFDASEESLRQAEYSSDIQANQNARQRIASMIQSKPESLMLDETFQHTSTDGGKAVFWTGGVMPVDADGNPAEDAAFVVLEETIIDAHTHRQVKRYANDVKLMGFGRFNLDLLFYHCMGVDLQTKANATLDTLDLPPKIIAPFLVMIVFSFFTQKNSRTSLDRYYTKMKTPVVPDRVKDAENLAAAYQNPSLVETKKLLPGSQLEFQRPTLIDVMGFIVSCLVCFGIIGIAVLIANIGG